MPDDVACDAFRTPTPARSEDRAARQFKRIVPERRGVEIGSTSWQGCPGHPRTFTMQRQETLMRDSPGCEELGSQALNPPLNLPRSVSQSGK